MTAEIIQFVPRPNPDRERKLAEEAAKILKPFVDTSPSEMIPYHGAGIDGIDLGKEPA